MSMCEVVSDRMPAVASGRSEWTREERAHLASCGDCAAEWKLVQSASRLGRGLTVDAGQVGSRVLEQVRQAVRLDRRRRWMRRGVQVGGLALAAALLLVVMPRRRAAPVPAATGTPMPVAATGRAGLQLAELDDAAPAELEMVLVEFDEPAVPESSLDGPDLEGLNTSQVERALRAWEES